MLSVDLPNLDSSLGTKKKSTRSEIVFSPKGGVLLTLLVALDSISVQDIRQRRGSATGIAASSHKVQYFEGD
jgi:hypothetical protein